MKPRPTAPDGRPLAEFVDRFLARLIDGLIMFGVMLVVMIPVVIAMIAIIGSASSNVTVNEDGTLSDGDSAAIVLPIIGLYVLLFVLGVVFSYAYEVELPLRKGGQTYGKRAMKIAIIPLQPGAQLTRGELAKRWFVQVFGGIIPFFQWIDGLWQLWDQPFRQCLHDKFAKTAVVKVGQ